MYKRIVVGTDGSIGANAAVDTAIELARLTGATLHVVPLLVFLGVLTWHSMTLASFETASSAAVGAP